MSRFSFRGKTLKGDWVYGNLAIITKEFEFCGLKIKPGSYISNSVGLPFAYPVRPKTVGQSTGLLDCNGTEIFEGDVVNMPVVFYDCEPTVWGDAEIYWNETGFYYRHKMGNTRWTSYLGADNKSENLKIIGNIHEYKK